MNKVSKDEFLKRLKSIHSATSENGARYLSINTNGRICTGIRESTGKKFEIDVDRLYSAYFELKQINTIALKKYVDRVQSPSLAILIEAKLV